jgi:ethanolamine utilization protein EutA (predicted chaperonin)
MNTTKYPYGKTATIKVYSLATGAFLRYDRQGAKPEEVGSQAVLTIDADSIRERVATERINAIATVEHDYEGTFA